MVQKVRLWVLALGNYRISFSVFFKQRDIKEVDNHLVAKSVYIVISNNYRNHIGRAAPTQLPRHIKPFVRVSKQNISVSNAC